MRWVGEGGGGGGWGGGGGGGGGGERWGGGVGGGGGGGGVSGSPARAAREFYGRWAGGGGGGGGSCRGAPKRSTRRCRRALARQLARRRQGRAWRDRGRVDQPVADRQLPPLSERCAPGAEILRVCGSARLGAGARRVRDDRRYADAKAADYAGTADPRASGSAGVLAVVRTVRAGPPITKPSAPWPPMGRLLRGCLRHRACHDELTAWHQQRAADTHRGATDSP